MKSLRLISKIRKPTIGRSYATGTASASSSKHAKKEHQGASTQSKEKDIEQQEPIRDKQDDKNLLYDEKWQQEISNQVGYCK
jgi:hypothetical protein